MNKVDSVRKLKCEECEECEDVSHYPDSSVLQISCPS